MGMIRMETSKNNLISPVTLQEMDLKPQDRDSELISYQHPKDIYFTHKYIEAELLKFDLTTQGCNNCSPLQRHFEDPCSHYDQLSEQEITWVCHSEAKMVNPFPLITIPMSDPANVTLTHPPHRPRGFIRVSRIAEKIEDRGDFQKIAKAASAGILRNLTTRPLATKEIQYKLNQDFDSNLLISLKNFLNKPEVRQ